MKTDELRADIIEGAKPVRMIDVDALLDQFTTGALLFEPAVREVIEKQPVISIPYQQGTWKTRGFPQGDLQYCSVCGFGKRLEDHREYNFCPICGSRNVKGE